MSQPTELTLYIDEAPVAQLKNPKNPWRMALDHGIGPGEHRPVVNWSSDFGPVAVAVTRLFVDSATAIGSRRVSLR